MEFKKFWKYSIFFLIVFLIIISISESPEKENEYKENKYSEKENSLEIPKIVISAPLIFVESSDKSVILKTLEKGAVHFPTSVLPGKIGQTIILGHSAPPDWPKIKYNWIFSRLNELGKGDEIFIYFNGKKYSYLVENKIFLERGEEIPATLTVSKNTLILISCWPPGKDIRRIAVVAE